MPTDDSMAAIEAVVDTLIPGGEDGPGAAELGVHRHVAEAIDAAFPGFVDMLALLLNAFAADVRSGAQFLELDADERGEVIRAMAREESQDMKEIVGALFLFTYGGMYSEWTGFDRSTGALRAPAVWKELGYRGPVRGNPEYRGDAG
jgi:hypothetical protein